MKIKILLILYLSYSAICIGQKRHMYSKCELITFFLKSKKVDSCFKNVEIGADSIVIADLSTDLNDCPINYWRGLPISIINKGPLVDSLKKYSANYVVKNRMNIYIFYAYKVENVVTSFTIKNGTSHIFSTVDVKEKNNKFRFIGGIINSVE